MDSPWQPTRSCRSRWVAEAAFKRDQCAVCARLCFAAPYFMNHRPLTLQKVADAMRSFFGKLSDPTTLPDFPALQVPAADCA